MLKILTEYWFILFGLVIGVLVVVVESIILERRRKQNSSPREEVQETGELNRKELGQSEIKVESNILEEKPVGEVPADRTSGVAQEPGIR